MIRSRYGHLLQAANNKQVFIHLNTDDRSQKSGCPLVIYISISIGSLLNFVLSIISVSQYQKSALEFTKEENIAVSYRELSLDNLTAYLNLKSLGGDSVHGAKIDTLKIALAVEKLSKRGNG